MQRMVEHTRRKRRQATVRKIKKDRKYKKRCTRRLGKRKNNEV